MLFDPRPTNLSDFTTIRRQAVRPAHARDADFDAQFDDDTLFFDAFRSADGDRLVLIGPSFFNLGEAIAGASVRDRRTGAVLPAEVRSYDRHAQLWVDAAPGIEEIELSAAFGSVVIPVGDNKAELFAGRRVLLTQSRNNSLQWIQDWARFNRDVHGADAIIFYDNGSTLYRAEDVHEALGGLAGFAQVVVVRWPFKFGPQGPDAWRYWDSDFGQLGAWEHARRRFLAKAASVMNSDIDELTPSRQSLFAMAEASPFGVARYYGRWIHEMDSGAAAADPMARRHREFRMVQRRKLGRGRFLLPIDVNRCQPKWTAVPRRCPDRAQWHVHTIKGWLPALLVRRDVAFRHFRPITTSWKYHRETRMRFDPALYEEDRELDGRMAGVDWER